MTARSDPPALHVHAMDNLRFIRQTMERAGPFTAVPGWGGVLIGLTAFAASALSGPSADRKWLMTWLGAACVAGIVGVVAMVRKARASNSPLFGAPLRRFALAYLPPLAAGAVLTAVFVAGGVTERDPGSGLRRYDTAVATGGALSVRIVRIMGFIFMVLGVAAFVAPTAWGNSFM